MIFLFQVSNCVLYFTDVLWPEFTIWNLLAAIIHFQRHAPPLKVEKPICDSKLKFLEKMEDKRWKDLEKLVQC